MSVFSVIVTRKERDVTSFSSLSPIKNACRGSKVGHCGTLDRFACGLMCVLTGEATRLNPLFSGFDKSYRARMVFGSETDTLDPEGQVIRTSDVIPSVEDIREVLPSFLGEQDQTPPVYSAIHVGGRRAYAQARKGVDVEMPSRRIRIDSISMLDYDPPYLVFDVSVSKGTYIRSLARDIAYRLGSVAHLVDLERYRIGPFTYGDVTGIPASLEESERNLAKVIPAVIDFDRRMLGRLADGYMSPRGILSIDMPQEVRYRLHCDGRLVGVVERRDDGRWSIVALVNREDL